jgi:thioredoxin-like negative regulator of GroEL
MAGDFHATPVYLRVLGETTEGGGRVANVLGINDWLLERELARRGSPVLVLYHGIDGGTRGSTRVFREAARRHAGTARFLQVNVNENPSLMERHRIRRLPSVIAYVANQEAARRQGALDEDDILDLLPATPEQA